MMRFLEFVDRHVAITVAVVVATIAGLFTLAGILQTVFFWVVVIAAGVVFVIALSLVRQEFRERREDVFRRGPP